ncbi:hypothetical protein C8F01DRAFT_1259799 [Mycena amicta]|nr:hypothetical protein C8F01DRAFT_1259799 [Mycena amicta]
MSKSSWLVMAVPMSIRGKLLIWTWDPANPFESPNPAAFKTQITTNECSRAQIADDGWGWKQNVLGHSAVIEGLSGQDQPPRRYRPVQCDSTPTNLHIAIDTTTAVTSRPLPYPCLCSIALALALALAITLYIAVTPRRRPVATALSIAHNATPHTTFDNLPPSLRLRPCISRRSRHFLPLTNDSSFVEQQATYGCMPFIPSCMCLVGYAETKTSPLDVATSGNAA